MPGETGDRSPWPYRVIEHGSKLGIHSIRPNRVGQFAEDMAAAGAAFSVVKAVDDLEWLNGVKQVSPETITLARLTSRWEGCGNVERPTTDLDEMADQLLEVILDKLAARATLREVVDYWEICNEPDPPGADGYRRLSLLMIKCMERAEAEGLSLAIFALNSGTPEWDEMVAMVDTGVFARARQGGHILALHEGVFWHDRPIDFLWENPIPGGPTVPGAGALHFRYRYLYHLLKERGEVVPLVVTEWYGGHYAQHGTTPEQVVDQVRWCDEKYREDYYFLGFCPFTLGPVGQWGEADYEFAYPALVEYAVSIREEPNAGPAPDEEEPEEEPDEAGRGAPREQYKRIYVLLPPDADSSWTLAVVRGTWDSRRFTVGGSADDAGIGDLDSRIVIAVNPSHWERSLEEFFETYYSGVQYVPVEAETPEELSLRLSAIDV